MELLPAMDLRDGECVRLYQGDFDAETRYALRPRDLYDRYVALGARWMHVVDLDGAREGAGAHTRVIAELAGLGGLEIQAGGGLREEHDLKRLFDAGVRRVVVGSAAIRKPLAVLSWLDRHGPDRIVLALDVRVTDGAGGLPPVVLTHGWRETSHQSLWSVLAPFAAAGLKHVLCTDVARDGAMAGPNVALYREARERFPALAWQASGGIRGGADLAELAVAGLAHAIVGRALIEGTLTRDEVAPYLPDA